MNDHYFGITDPGKVRTNNEDAFVVARQAGSARILAAVIDGVGGYEGGEVAAAIASDCITVLLDQPIQDVAASLRASLVEINSRIIAARAAQSGRANMACVLTLVLADPETNQFDYVHVGDTRLYLLRGASLVKVSKDHSFVGFLEESNRLTEEDAMRHPKRNEVNKVLGMDPDISTQPDYIDSGSSPFLPGDLLLLCSDGLTDMVDSRQITDLLTTGETLPAKAKALIDAANGAGGQDNVTVVLVQNPKVPASHVPTMPSTESRAEVRQEAPEALHDIRQGGSGKPLTWLLALLCLGLAGLSGWLYMRQPGPPVAASDSPVATAPQAPLVSVEEQSLQDSLSRAADSLVIDTTVFPRAMVVHSLAIEQDTFRLSGNGLVMRADSNTSAAALRLGPNSRYVVLENMTFENFHLAIQAQQSALRLRNVRFINCGSAVSYDVRFPDTQPVSGIFSPAAPNYIDSSADNNQAWR